jgi:hypothetical protein
MFPMIVVVNAIVPQALPTTSSHGCTRLTPVYLLDSSSVLVFCFS